MNKSQFLAALEKGLGGLPAEETNERLTFYGEMIDDFMEEDLTEEEAIQKIGAVGDIVTQILTDDAVQPKKVKSKRKLGALEITLLAIGSPIWLSLLIAAFAAVISLYAVLWSVIISFWAVFAAFIGCAACGIFMLVLECVRGNPTMGIAMLGIGIFSVGAAIFCFHGCKAATRGAVWITKKSFLAMRSVFVKKEDKK